MIQIDTDRKGDFRSKCGHVAGLNILSEVILEKTAIIRDFMISDKVIGVSMGKLFVHPILMISRKLTKLLREKKIKGLDCEVVHMG